MNRFIAVIFTLLPIFLVFIYKDSTVYRSPGSEGLKYIIFDLDGTLVESLGMEVPGDIVLDSGEAYHVFSHAHELVERATRAGLEVHFYSGGPTVRNIELLSKLKLSNGKSFLEMASSVLGREDLVDLGEEFEGKYFTDRFRKDLSRIGPINQLIIVEDNPFFPLNEAQRERVLKLPLHDEVALKSWRKENRLAWVHGVFDDLLSGQDLEILNSENINSNIVHGLEFLGKDSKKNLSRHGCAGIFYSLSY